VANDIFKLRDSVGCLFSKWWKRQARFPEFHEGSSLCRRGIKGETARLRDVKSTYEFACHAALPKSTVLSAQHPVLATRCGTLPRSVTFFCER